MSTRHAIRHAIRLSLALMIELAPCAALHAQQSAPDPAFTFTETMVPMRDGVRMHTVYFIPKNQTGPLPILLVRTPYGIPARNFPISLAYKEFVDEGFIFAFQDIRGKFGSEGTFVMQRAPRPMDAGRGAIDESTDAYDATDWLVKGIPNNNGRVGMFGVSYPGWTTAMAMLDPHPALKA